MRFSMEKINSLPFYLLFGLLASAILWYLQQGFPFIFAIARGIGLTLPPLLLGIACFFFNKPLLKRAFLIVTIFWWLIFVFGSQVK